jgi:hypothetical protein
MRLAAGLAHPVARRGPVVFSSTRDVRTATRAFCVGVMVRSRALAAGVTWTSRTMSAPWAGGAGSLYGRTHHASVIDAAGAIYVIGGHGQFSFFGNDVWVSTNGAGVTAMY